MKQTEYTHFNGIYGINLKGENFNYIFSEPLEKRSRVFNWKIKPHLHASLYQLFFVEKQGGVLQLFGKNHILKAPVVVSIPPGFVHGFEWDDKVRGRIITISDSLVENLLLPTPNVQVQFNDPLIIVPADEQIFFRDINQLLLNIDKEFITFLPERKQMLNYLFGQLAIILFRNVKNKIIGNNITETRYFTSFCKLVKNSLFGQKSIKDFAEQLNITTVHLNRVCNTVAGKSALMIVNDYFVKEAQKQLLYTDQSIKEIAIRLNFEDLAYFSRLFKKHTGLSPKEFRSEGKNLMEIT